MQGPSGPSVLQHERGADGAARGTGGGREDAALRWLASHLTGLQSSTAVAARGAAAHMSPLNARRWSVQQRQESAGHMEHLQWVPAHCGLPGNEQADALTKEATGLIQQGTPFDARTLAGATARRAKRSWLAGRPEGWYRSIMTDSEPPRRCGATPERRRWMDVHQLRVGHWGRSEQ